MLGRRLTAVVDIDEAEYWRPDVDYSYAWPAVVETWNAASYRENVIPDILDEVMSDDHVDRRSEA